MNLKNLRHAVREAVEPTLSRMGFDLVAVELVAGRRQTLRLSVDGPAGVGIDDLTRITHRLSPLLDEADPIEAAYDLEVSSPGIERPVQRLSDYRRFLGFRARIVMEEGVGRRRYTGRLAAVEGGDVHVDVDGVVHVLPFEQIERAHLVLDLGEFERLAALPWGETAGAVVAHEPDAAAREAGASPDLSSRSAGTSSGGSDDHE